MKTVVLDPATLERARAGDSRAFRALYEHHADLVYGFLLRMLRDRAAAEDAVQDVFVRVLGALRRFDPAGPAQLSTWILAIARRVALGELERRRARPSGSLEGAGAVPAPLPPPELRLALEAAIGVLPEVLRSTFVLRECCALSYQEVATLEGIDLGTVKSRLYRARAALQTTLVDGPADSNERIGHEAIVARS